ncbi:MAG TPA: AraC family transcriptional regulator [Terriglobales bacterium]|nr:AraC family transcriptional regulator [Terriglobales bacterium]
MAEAKAPVMLGGSFYGAVRQRHEQCDAIFTDLQHSVARRLPEHAHELPFFALLLQGDYRERYGRQLKEFGPFTISYRPAGVPHQDEIGPSGVRFFEIEVRPGWRKRIRDCSGNLDAAHDEYAGGEMLWLAMELFRETHAPEGDSALHLENLLAELLACVAHMPRETANDAPQWLGCVVDRLKSEYCERLTLENLAREAGVHPVHLSRVFRKCKGEGIGKYVHRLRIQAACERMLASRKSLAEISLETGFADQSHFTRAFRRITGMSPAAFRRLVTARVQYAFAAD